MKHKEPISDRYAQDMGWGNLHFGPLENITQRTDILTTGRLARDVVGMHRAIREDPNLPFGTPSLLHPISGDGHTTKATM